MTLQTLTNAIKLFQKRIIVFFCLLSVCISPLFSQVKLPSVPEAKHRYAKIKGTYIPRDDFAHMFPNFLKDGGYIFDYEYAFKTNAILSTNNDLDQAWYSGLFSFNSQDYPVTEVSSAQNLSGLGKILVQLTTDSASNISSRGINLGNNKFTDKETNIESATDIEQYLNLVKYVSDAKEKYEDLNRNYQKLISDILHKKQADSFSISQLGTLVLDSTLISKTNLIFQFVFVQSNIWLSKNVSKKFPSHALFKLLVKDPSGELVNSYSQAIFFEGSGSNIIGGFVLETTLPIAMENLINRFLNDQVTVQKVVTIVSEENAVRKALPHYDSLYTHKRMYNIIRSKKSQLLFDLACLSSKYSTLSNSNKERETAILNRDRSLDNNVMTSTITGIGYGNWARGIRKGLEASQQKIFALKQTALSINIEEKSFIEKLNKVFNNPFDITFVLDTKEMDNRTLNNVLSKLSNKKDETFASFQNTSNTVDKDFGAVFSNNLNSFIKDASGTGNNFKPMAVETSAISNGGGGINQKMDACQQQATAEAYKSQEYINWNNTKLHADASDYKAKMIELTLQYCRDKLPPNEVQALTQAAANERKVARELRAAKGTSIRQ